MDLISTLRYAAKRKKEEEAKKAKTSAKSEGSDPASEADGGPLEDDGQSGPDAANSDSRSSRGPEKVAMESIEWSEEEARVFLKGMRYVATVRETRPLSDLAEEMLDAVGQHVLHVDVAREELTGFSVVDLKSGVVDERRRMQLVQFLILVPYLDMEVDAEQVAVVDEIAQQLGLEPETLTDLHRVRDNRMGRLLFDYSRRTFAEYVGAESAWDKIRAVGRVVKQYVGDDEVAERYRALEAYPEGSLGKTLYQFYRMRNFPLPGEKKSFSDLTIPHDCCHIMGGFNTDMNGEMDVAGFEAGLFDTGFGFELLLEVILDFHLGKKFTTMGLLPVGVGHFDPERVLVGYERGVSCKVNLLDGWDFWSDAREPVTELRARYGLSNISEPILLPAPTEISRPPDHAGHT